MYLLAEFYRRREKWATRSGSRGHHGRSTKQEHTDKGIELFAAPKAARINIGQAPGLKTQKQASIGRTEWNRLREWLELMKLSIIQLLGSFPMDFYSDMVSQATCHLARFS